MKTEEAGAPLKDAKRRALGKGIEALLPGRPSAPQKPEAAEVVDGSGQPREIDVEMIERNPFQTRTRFDEAQLIELSVSIAASGVIQPIIVRPLADGRYQLIAGERRLLASKHIAKATIPAIIRRVSDEQAMEMTIVENLQRSDLNPMEQARAYERLSREFKMTHEQMALRTGKERATVGNFLRLMRLPPVIQGHIESGEISFGHARAILALESPEAMLKVTQKILALSMSVRQTETYVQGALHPERRQAEPKVEALVDPNVRDACEQVQRALGLKVRIEDKQGRGRVIIEYSRLEDFDTLLETLLGK